MRLSAHFTTLIIHDSNINLWGEYIFCSEATLYIFSYGYLVTSVICMNFIKSMKGQNNKEKTRKRKSKYI